MSHARTTGRQMPSVGVQLIEAVKRMHLRFSQENLDRIALAWRQPPLKTGVCAPIGAVSASYGQGYISARVAEIDEIASLS